MTMKLACSMGGFRNFAFEDALAVVQKGPLPSAALDRLTALRQTFAGEPR